MSYRGGILGRVEQVTLAWAVLDTPVGPVAVGADDRAVHAVRLSDPVGSGAAAPSGARPAPLAAALAQLREYFAGDRTGFDLPLAEPADSEPPLAGLGRSRLERAVWEELTRIPYGATRTYGQVAASVGEPEAARAVGTACHRNPFPVVVPCHRVVGAAGRLVGFGAGVDRKRWLLEHEARISLERVWS